MSLYPFQLSSVRLPWYFASQNKGRVVFADLVEGWNSVNHPARHSVTNCLRYSAACRTPGVTHSSQCCRFLNSVLLIYFTLLRFMASSLDCEPAFDFLTVQVSPRAYRFPSELLAYALQSERTVTACAFRSGGIKGSSLCSRSARAGAVLSLPLIGEQLRGDEVSECCLVRQKENMPQAFNQSSDLSVDCRVVCQAVKRVLTAGARTARSETRTERSAAQPRLTCNTDT